MPSARFPGAFPDHDNDTSSNVSATSSDAGSFVTAYEYPQHSTRDRHASVLKARKVSMMPSAARVTMIQAHSVTVPSPLRTSTQPTPAATTSAPVRQSLSRGMSLDTAAAAQALLSKRPLGQAVYAQHGDSFKPFAPVQSTGSCPPPSLSALSHQTHGRKTSSNSVSTAQSMPRLTHSSRSSSLSIASGSTMSSYGQGIRRNSDEISSRGPRVLPAESRGVSSVFASDFATDPFRPGMYQPGRSSQHASLHLPPPTPPLKSPRHQQTTRPAADSTSFLRHDPYSGSSVASSASASRLTCASSLFARDLSDDPFRPPTFVEPDASKHVEIYLPAGAMGMKPASTSTTARSTPASSIRTASTEMLGQQSRSRNLSTSVKDIFGKVRGKATVTGSRTAA